ncbi:MAG: hypothetical protein IKT98_04515 [Selenomonadaceae bacterium]|nr:hypothetical protein [Selenomonadaceae bacterium]
MGLQTFIIILIISAFFSLHSDLYWIIYDYRLILWIIFAFSIYSTVKKHEIKGLLILSIFSFSVFIIISHLIDSNLISHDVMIVIKNVLWGSVIAFVFNIGDVVYYVFSNLGYESGKNISTKHIDNSEIENVSESNNEIDLDEALRLYEIEKLEEECEEIENEIKELRYQRDEIRIGGWLDNTGYDKPMSREEESRNRRLYDEISSKIRDLEFQKEEKERKISSLQK